MKFFAAQRKIKVKRRLSTDENQTSRPNDVEEYEETSTIFFSDNSLLNEWYDSLQQQISTENLNFENDFLPNEENSANEVGLKLVELTSSSDVAGESASDSSGSLISSPVVKRAKQTRCISSDSDCSLTHLSEFGYSDGINSPNVSIGSPFTESPNHVEPLSDETDASAVVLTNYSDENECTSSSPFTPFTQRTKHVNDESDTSAVAWSESSNDPMEALFKKRENRSSSDKSETSDSEAIPKTPTRNDTGLGFGQSSEVLKSFQRSPRYEGFSMKEAQKVQGFNDYVGHLGILGHSLTPQRDYYIVGLRCFLRFMHEQFRFRIKELHLAMIGCVNYLMAYLQFVSKRDAAAKTKINMISCYKRYLAYLLSDMERNRSAYAECKFQIEPGHCTRLLEDFRRARVPEVKNRQYIVSDQSHYERYNQYLTHREFRDLSTYVREAADTLARLLEEGQATQREAMEFQKYLLAALFIDPYTQRREIITNLDISDLQKAGEEYHISIGQEKNSHNKTAQAERVGRQFPIPEHIGRWLETWIQIGHKAVRNSKNIKAMWLNEEGLPLSAGSVTRYIQQICEKVIGKWVGPQTIRKNKFTIADRVLDEDTTMTQPEKDNLRNDMAKIAGHTPETYRKHYVLNDRQAEVKKARKTADKINSMILDGTPRNEENRARFIVPQSDDEENKPIVEEQLTQEESQAMKDNFNRDLKKEKEALKENFIDRKRQRLSQRIPGRQSVTEYYPEYLSKNQQIYWDENRIIIPIHGPEGQLTDFTFDQFYALIRHTHPEITTLSTQYVANTEAPLPDSFNWTEGRAVFAHLVRGNHWVFTTATILGRSVVVTLHDPMRNRERGIPQDIQATVLRQIKRLLARTDTLQYYQVEFRLDLQFDIQPNGYDCGVYCIAGIVDFLLGREPSDFRYNNAEMREHLYNMFVTGNITPFPSKRRTPQKEDGKDKKDKKDRKK